MVINKKKRQPCSGIIQDMITFRRKKKKMKTRFRTHVHTYIHTHSVHLAWRGCAVTEQYVLRA